MKPTIGTVIWGTLRTQDLLDAFLLELTTLDKDNWTARRIDDKLSEMNEEYFEEYLNSEDAQFDLEDLMTELNRMCEDIPHMYFGTIEGDGSDFGFWMDDEVDDEI
jgi:hypothetical protein